MFIFIDEVVYCDFLLERDPLGRLLLAELNRPACALHDRLNRSEDTLLACIAAQGMLLRLFPNEGIDAEASLLGAAHLLRALLALLALPEHHGRTCTTFLGVLTSVVFPGSFLGCCIQMFLFSELLT